MTDIEVKTLITNDMVDNAIATLFATPEPAPNKTWDAVRANVRPALENFACDFAALLDVPVATPEGSITPRARPNPTA